MSVCIYIYIYIYIYICMYVCMYVYIYICQKGRDDLTGLIWREGKFWTSSETLMKEMKSCVSLVIII